MNRDLDPISGRAVQVANSLGLWDHLSKTARPLAELAEACQCPPRGLRPLLYLLASVDLLRQQGDGFLLAPGALRYVKNKWAAAFAAFPEVPEFAQLEQAVRTGRPVRPPVEGSEDEGEFFATVVPALFELHHPDASHLVERIPAEVSRVLDLGAGSAVWSLPLAQARAHARVVAVDRARVLEQVTAEFLRRHQVLEQYELWPGDYHQVELPQQQFDLVYLGHLLHADGWEMSPQLLARSYACLRPGGLLAVAEIVASEPRARHYASNVFDLSMLMLTEHGVVFSRRELSRLREEAGFVNERWIKGPGEYPVLLAERPV